MSVEDVRAALDKAIVVVPPQPPGEAPKAPPAREAGDAAKPARKPAGGRRRAAVAPAPADAPSSPAEPDDPETGPAADADVEFAPGFQMTADGLFHCPGGGGTAGGPPPPPTWIADPFDIIGRCRTGTSEAWGIVVAFADPDGVVKMPVIAASDLAGDGASVRQTLAGAGLAISAKKSARDKFTECLAGVRTDQRVLLADRCGWTADQTRFVLGATTIGAGDPVVLDGAGKGAAFAAAGTVADWKGWVGDLAASHDMLVFHLALAFTGPLLEPLGLDGSGFHLVGRSSAGKTTALVIAASVWGNTNFVQTWRATANGLEGVAAAHNDGLLLLDEIGIANAADVATATYMLASGSGKSRMRSDGGQKDQRRWRVTFASTGEVSLADKIAEDGRHRAMAGQEVRLVDLRIPPDSTSGVFSGEGSPEHFAGLARRIKTAATRAHGTAGPAFVRCLVANRDGHVADAKKLMADFQRAYVPEGADGQVGRVGARFALVAAAGELAALEGILPFPVGHVSAATGRLFQDWLAARGGLGSSEDRQAIQRVAEFVHVHGSSRFQKLRSDGDPETGFGPQDESWRAQYGAGYQRGATWYFNDAAWREALDGLDVRAAAEALHRAGFLTKDGVHRKIKVSTPKGRFRLYAVSAKILETDEG